MESSDDHHRCPVCPSSFGRAEHLKRHVNSHKNQKPFKCLHCAKCFSRSDTLNRHTQIHLRSTRGGNLSIVKSGNGPGRTPRACIKCASARARCGGEKPCERCIQRSLLCEYRSSSSSSEKAKAVQRSNGASVRTETPQISNSQTHLMIGEPLSQISPPQGNTYPATAARMQEVSPDINVVTEQHPNTVQDMTDSTRWNSYHINPVATDTTETLLPAPSSQLDGSPTANFNVQPFNTDVISNLNWLPLSFPGNYYEDFHIMSPVSFSTGGPQSDLYNQSQTLPQYAQPLSNMERNMIASGADVSWSPSQFMSNAVGTQDPSSLNESVIPPSTVSSSQEGYTVGSYYVDGGGARLSVAGKRRRFARRRSSHPNSLSAQDEWNLTWPVLSFPILNDSPLSEEKSRYTDEQIYSQVSSWFHRIGGLNEDGFPQPSSAPFLSHNVFESLVRLAVENFLPVVPIIHTSYVNPRDAHWLTHLALATLGSHYLEHEQTQHILLNLHEFLQRAVNMLSLTMSFEDVEELQFIQVKLLSYIASAYSGISGSKTNVELHSFEIYDFAGKVLQNPSLSMIRPISNNMSANETDWRHWIQKESLKRTAYYIWLLDCMMFYHFQTRTRFSIEDAQIPLPCTDEMWTARSLADWVKSSTANAATPSLCTATQTLYVEKKCEDIGEFGRILLIHALFQQTWTIGRYHGQSLLSSWIPSAPKQASDFKLSQDPVWLPGHPIYSRWRNSACDCLDVLHWAANGTIGTNSGVEHPTVLHLHIARVILLTPYDDIRKLAFARVGQGNRPDEQELRQARLQIQRWLQEDQYKARLAMIHAGVTFWYVRRHSADAFYEPDAVLLASLAMWAYGSKEFRTENQTAAQNKVGKKTASSPDPDAQAPDFIHLDRPTDDELVQLFVKDGYNMIANVTAVGDLRGTHGPERILREGCKLLTSLTSWGISSEHGRVLSRLADYTKAH